MLSICIELKYLIGQLGNMDTKQDSFPFEFESTMNYGILVKIRFCTGQICGLI